MAEEIGFRLDLVAEEERGGHNGIDIESGDNRITVDPEWHETW